MLIKTVVDKLHENAQPYTSYCRAADTEGFQETELYLADAEYDEAFADALSREIEAYSLHTVLTFDYESSSDAGDGRDDYYKEEGDEQPALASCIVRDGRLFGFLCESFETQGFLLLDRPETVISHPGNYGGRNYHFYRTKNFSLVKKAK